MTLKQRELVDKMVELIHKEYEKEMLDGKSRKGCVFYVGHEEMMMIRELPMYFGIFDHFSNTFNGHKVIEVLECNYLRFV